jgi:hypothetical protein
VRGASPKKEGQQGQDCHRPGLDLAQLHTMEGTARVPGTSASDCSSAW